MKLVANPIRVSASLHKMIPKTIDYLYGKHAIKYFQMYTVGSTHVYYVDAFTRIDIIMTNEKRRISQEQIDFVVDKLLHEKSDAAALNVDHVAKSEIETHIHRHLKVNDIVIIEKPVTTDQAQ
ncbi:hypothetical protein IV38_GL002089 [Lactobacillus selangorensis]|uniref:Uncharacterized protein n=1 Tax=Lactobacillus selangorensis TaxID=81857 RepID=A0A0R2FRT1_9LACO|nr:DUF1827 family protein [Lactobacillus selangorensis]KRN27437.1 hypothetical protein IV38_GL002089 [Lactobacillus selangorensis]KRN31366.1 hypothetical protein IV40_GL001361 [Lactobacillus selangorensis]